MSKRMRFTCGVAPVIGLLTAVMAVAGPQDHRAAAVKPTRAVPTTQAARSADVAQGVTARAFLGFWTDHGNVEGDRPGDAATVVRILSGHAGDGHFGVSLTLALPPRYTGVLNYRERLTLPARPRTWDIVDAPLQQMTLRRELSPDGRSSMMHEQFEWQRGKRILPVDGDTVENLPTPFTCYDFDAGDPPGEWTLECWVNDVPVAHFAFKVVRGNAGETATVVVKDDVANAYRPRALGSVVLPGQ